MMQIRQVDKESVDVYWDKVKNWIHKVVKQSHGRHSLFTTYELLKKGTMTMFLVEEKNKLCAVYVVQTIYYPAKIVLGILFCGGSKIIKNVKQIENFFIKFAKKKKFKSNIIYCPPSILVESFVHAFKKTKINEI